MKKILIIALSFLMNFALLALSPEAKYNDAHTAFKTNDFQKAANLYRQMVDEDSIVSADVYYNLANAYYRLNDFPSAILFYHKTLKLDADYVDAAYNLRLSERNLEDKIEPVPQLFYIRWYRSLCASLSTDSWNNVVLPDNTRNCFGKAVRERGHNLVPEPPHKITGVM